jgi:chorismate synthase
MPNTFGHIFRITTFGESHGGAVGVVVDGCPPKLSLSEKDIQPDLDRRRPGQSHIVTQRKEADRVEILSGVFEGKTTGTPIAMLVRNEDARSDAYSEIKTKYRPSHADYTYFAKYGIRNWEGGGRSSARETIGRVAAGAIARKWLHEKMGIEVLAYVKRIHDIEAKIDPNRVNLQQVESEITRCPHPQVSRKMIALIERVRKDGDSVGGLVECIARNVPAGLGDPVFDRLEADLAKAMLSLPATKGFEIGSGFAGTFLKGSQHNDSFVNRKGSIRTKTNFSGGIQGGISNGEDIIFRVGFKPTATIMRKQKTVDIYGSETTLKPKGRHDPCVLPRAVPMVEAMALLVLADHALRQRTIKS